LEGVIKINIWLEPLLKTNTPLLLLLFMIHPLEHLGMHGGGADERVEHRGGTGGPSVCPHGLVYHMNELHVLLMPPKGSVLLLSGATSSSMLRGDSETECLLEELDDGAFDDRVFLGKILVTLFHIVVALTHNECTGGLLSVGKTHKRSLWSDGNYGEFYLLLLCEGDERGSEVWMGNIP
jgi:hypothetical protein